MDERVENSRHLMIDDFCPEPWINNDTEYDVAP